MHSRRALLRQTAGFFALALLGQDSYLIQPVDPLGGTRLDNDWIRAPLVSFERSMALNDARR